MSVRPVNAVAYPICGRICYYLPCRLLTATNQTSQGAVLFGGRVLNEN